MKKILAVVSPLIVGALLLFSSIAGAQLKQIPATQQKSVVPSVSFFAAGSYYGPNLSKINEVYQVLEKNAGYPGGDDFKSRYLVVAGIRFTPAPGQSIQGEFGGTVSRAVGEKTSNFFQVYYTGGSYIMSFPLPMVSAYGGGGLGYLWLNSDRTYSGYPGVAHVNAQLAELHGMLGVEFFDPSGVSFSLEAKYSYAATLAPERADLDLTLKGVSIGVRIGVPISM